jgi:hypothetical protein
MKIENTDKEVSSITIPTCKSENPNMIETVGMPVNAPATAIQPQGVPAPKAGPAVTDIKETKPPVALPA